MGFCPAFLSQNGLVGIEATVKASNFWGAYATGEISFEQGLLKILRTRRAQLG